MSPETPRDTRQTLKRISRTTAIHEEGLKVLGNFMEDLLDFLKIDTLLLLEFLDVSAELEEAGMAPVLLLCIGLYLSFS